MNTTQLAGGVIIMRPLQPPLNMRFIIESIVEKP